jgi:hypothetical protein
VTEVWVDNISISGIKEKSNKNGGDEKVLSPPKNKELKITLGNQFHKSYFLLYLISVPVL